MKICSFFIFYFGNSRVWLIFFDYSNAWFYYSSCLYWTIFSKTRRLFAGLRLISWLSLLTFGAIIDNWMWCLPLLWVIFGLGDSSLFFLSFCCFCASRTWSYKLHTSFFSFSLIQGITSGFDTSLCISSYEACTFFSLFLVLFRCFRDAADFWTSILPFSWLRDST